MMIHKYGPASQQRQKVRVLKLEAGSWSGSGNWCIGKILLSGRFLSTPPGNYFYRSYYGTPYLPEKLQLLSQGQTYSYNVDQQYVYGTNTAYTFDDDWHDYEFSFTLSSGSRLIVDGSQVKYTAAANNAAEQSTWTYSQQIFSCLATADIKRMRVYSSKSVLKYDWDFENGDNEPAGWTNAEIAFVNL